MILPSPVISAYSNRKYRLADDYLLDYAGWHIAIAAGFIFDGASIPRLLWRVVGHPWQGLVLPAAAVHDALYATHLTTREQADELFRTLLLANGVGKLKAGTMYRAVRMFGGFAWNEPSEYEQVVSRRRVRVIAPPPATKATLP